MKIILISLVAITLLAGCTLEGKVDDRHRHEVKECVDSRDGERFSFAVSTAKNIRLGVNSVCMDVTDFTRKERHICTEHEAWLKCKTIGGKP